MRPYLSILLRITAGILLGFGPASKAASQCASDALLGSAVSIGSSGGGTTSVDINNDQILDLVSGLSHFPIEDFDGDGILDIVGFYVNVRLGVGANGLGNGSFEPQVHYGNTDSLALFKGNGDGSFSVAHEFDPGLIYGTSKVYSADLNADSIADLIVMPPHVETNVDSLLFTVLPGLGTNGVGDGTFGPPVGHKILSNFYDLRDMLVADINGDDLQDILILGWSEMWIFLGNGSNGVGDLTFYSSGPRFNAGVYYCGHIELNDLDSDGILDIQISGVSSNNAAVSVMRGNGSNGIGDGTFGTYSILPASSDGSTNGYPGLAFADLNHDGIEDILVGSVFLGGDFNPTFVPAVSVLLGQGSNGQSNGVFSQFIQYPLVGGSPPPPDIVVADWNSDHMIDVLSGTSHHLMLGTCPDPVLSVPEIANVADVPNDQGGWVSVAWNRSPLDASGSRIITGYIVWRRLSLPSALSKSLPMTMKSQEAVSRPHQVIRIRPDIDGVESFWEAMETVPAQFLEGYGYTSSTTQDSITGSNPYTAFFVSAITADPYLFFESAVDSGYSMDNLAPMKPSGLKGQRATSNLFIHWNPNQEPDLSYYAVYRGLHPFFDTNDLSRIDATTDTTVVDTDTSQLFYYKVSAIDIHGNESAHALLEPSDPPIAIAILDLSAASTETGVVLQWALSEEAVAVTTEVRVQRSSLESGPYDVIAVELDPQRRMSFRDTNVDAGKTYWYRPVLLSTGNTQVAGQAVRVVFGGFRWRTALYAPSVNSGSGNVDLRYAIGVSGGVRLEIFDVAGRRLRTLDQGSQVPGEYVAPWNGLNGSGVATAQGVYLVRLVVGSETATRKIVRLR